MLIYAIIASVALAAESPCRPDFPYRDGWLGGDAAYSVPLADGRSLWLFGDTFVGAEGAKDRSGSAMIANSVALSFCAGRGSEIRYHWRRGKGGKPRPFFYTGDEKVRYWPLDAFVKGRLVYVFLTRIRTTGPGPLDFSSEGTDLARLRVGPGEPAGWPLRLSSLWPGYVQLGAAVAVEGPYVYLFGSDMRPARSHQAFLVRASPAELDKDRPRFSYLAKDGVWKSGFDMDDAKAVLAQASSEFTVRRHGKSWVAVYSVEGLPSPGVAIRSAESLEGPWPSHRLVFRYPETTPGVPGYDPDTFCYAGKDHSEFGSGPELVLTYACNSWKFEKLVGRMDLYRPRTTVIPLD